MSSDSAEKDTTTGAFVDKACPSCGAALSYSWPMGSVKVGRQWRQYIDQSRYVANCLKCGWDEEVA
jgi:hypothetical protein